MFAIDLKSGTPIYEQIIEQTKEYVFLGVLKPNDKMPSVRSLSLKLSVNPNTIARAYSELCDKGVLYSAMGKGFFVTDDLNRITHDASVEGLNEFDEIVKGLKTVGIEKEKLIKRIEKLFNE